MNGSRQAVGRNVFETFLPVIDFTAVCMLSIAFGNDWKVFHLESVCCIHLSQLSQTYLCQVSKTIFRVISDLNMLEESMQDLPRISMAVRPL